MFYKLGVSENRGPYCSTRHSRVLIVRTPKQGTPNFRKLPTRGGYSHGHFLHDFDFKPKGTTYQARSSRNCRGP